MNENSLDKSSWGAGPWQNEPDELDWIDEFTGYKCIISRNKFGELCGYVHVSRGHDLYGTEYSKLGDVEVHGGLTCSKSAKDGWVFGFDCGHAFDYTPSMLLRLGFDRLNKLGVTYKGINYVKAECESLAKQLKERE